MKPNSDELIVHVILKECARNDEQMRDHAVKAIIEISRLRNLNEKRLLRYGIVSGIIPKERLAILKALIAIQAVSEDAEKTAV